MPPPLPQRGDALPRLTPRQVETLRFVCLGMSNEAIGLRLFISPSTVKNNMTAIYRALGVGSLGSAVRGEREQHRKAAWACYLLGASDIGRVLDPEGAALRPEQV